MATATDTPILEKTRELCDLIVNQPEFESIRARIDRFMINDEAQKQYQAVNDQGQMLHQKQHSGEQITDGEIEQFESRRKALLENPVARDFLEAQDEAFRMRDTVAKYVTKTFELGRVPTEEDLSEGECCGDSGCGCH